MLNKAQYDIGDGIRLITVGINNIVYSLRNNEINEYVYPHHVDITGLFEVFIPDDICITYDSNSVTFKRK